VGGSMLLATFLQRFRVETATTYAAADEDLPMRAPFGVRSHLRARERFA
jgi:hypothetical protein